MKHPEELVKKYGAKAGILMYVAKHLPNIPQVDMIVKTPDESIDDVLKRADKVPLLWPRIFRSSAEAELVGFEGDFPTFVVEDLKEMRATIKNPRYIGPYADKRRFDEYVRFVIERIETSPEGLREHFPNAGLPDRINVIIAEKSPSTITGTYVAHPNQDDFYLVACTLARTLDSNDAIRSNYTFRPREGVKIYRRYGNIESVLDEDLKKIKPNYLQQLEQVISWHDRIASLPEIDRDWTWQIEFGLDPVCLYQVRPFKPKQFANFAVNAQYPYQDVIVFGITSLQGLNVRIEKDVWRRHCDGEPINPDNKPSAHYDKLRLGQMFEYLPRYEAAILFDSIGFLSHNDVKAIRSAQVAVLSNDDGRQFNQGDWVNILSNGRKVMIKRIKEPKSS